ncbi:GNAT family N-acetyltransferase [Streptomyces massasporeus]|uniref:GNAT family N-acetyltransferase n=1 Tax=Streptomyces massasporeus TaxID=67324 RepID=UPI0036FCDD45
MGRLKQQLLEVPSSGWKQSRVACHRGRMLPGVDIPDRGARFRMRGAVEGDLLDIARLDGEVFPATPYPFFVLRQLFAMGCVPLVVEDGERICAYVLSSGQDGARCWILALAVAPDARARGLGRGLMRETLYELRRRGVREVLLSVEPANSAAIALYRSLGFTCDEALRRDYFGPGEDRLIMRSRL